MFLNTHWPEVDVQVHSVESLPQINNSIHRWKVSINPSQIFPTFTVRFKHENKFMRSYFSLYASCRRAIALPINLLGRR